MPIISGNMTADVVRDMNALAEAVDAAAGADGSLASKSDLGAIDVKLDEINTKSDQIKQNTETIKTTTDATKTAVDGIDAKLTAGIGKV
ncbi:hypothetical protein, partial [Lysinibacillus sp. TE18511]